LVVIWLLVSGPVERQNTMAAGACERGWCLVGKEGEGERGREVHRVTERRRARQREKGRDGGEGGKERRKEERKTENTK
jgi:hypothetical protein